MALGKGDFERAVELNKECADIAKRFIELQQGSLRLQAGDNEGTTAIVKLNIDPAQ